MPAISFLNVLIFLSVSSLVGWYLYRKLLTVIDAFTPKNLPLVKKRLARTVVALMSLPAIPMLLKEIPPLRETGVTYTLFFLGSVWGIWLFLALLVFVPADLTILVWKQARRVFARRKTKSLIEAQTTRADVARTRDDNPPLMPEKSSVYSPSRREFLKKAAPSMIGFAFPTVITGYSLVNNRMNYVVNQMTLSFPNLPSELRGLKIAHASDIHSGAFMSQRQMEEITQTLNSFHPDLVALTGDFVANDKNEIEPFVKGFRNLKSTYGTFACAGNHDEWVGIETVAAAMKQHAETLLRNEHRIINIDGAPLNVIGIDYTRSRTAYLDAAMKGTNPDGFNLLLCHHPDFFTYAKTANIDLMLAGHTHGGQIALDVAGVELYPIDILYKYPRGLFEEGEQGKQKLYVNLGAGVTGAPLRTISPEIVVMTLV